MNIVASIWPFSSSARPVSELHIRECGNGEGTFLITTQQKNVALRPRNLGQQDFFNSKASGPPHLIWGRVFAKPDVPVDAVYDILQRQLGNRFVCLNDLFGQRFHERFKILKSPPVLLVMHWK